MICKFCGSPNDDDNFICDNCGKPFDDELDLESLKDHRPKTISFDDEIVEPIFESQRMQAQASNFAEPISPIPEMLKPKEDFPPIPVDEVPESFKAVLYDESEHVRSSDPEKVRTVEYDNSNSPVEETVARRPLFNDDDLDDAEEEAKRKELRVMNNFRKCTVCGALIKDGSNRTMCSDCFNAKIETMVSKDAKEENSKGKIKIFTVVAVCILIIVIIAFVVLMMMFSSGSRREKNRNDYDALQSAIKQDEQEDAMNSQQYEDEEEDAVASAPISAEVSTESEDNAGSLYNKAQNTGAGADEPAGGEE